MGRFPVLRWSLFLLALLLAAACGKSGESSSSAVTVDKVPPTITSTSPANFNYNVGIKAVVSVAFSEAMDQASVAAAFSLSTSGGGVTVVPTYDPATKVATFTPLQDLAYDTVYYASLTTSAKDMVGNPLAQGMNWVFRTSAAADVEPPIVKAGTFSPADGAVDVQVTSHVSVEFNEPMDATSITGFSFYLLDKSNSFVEASVTYNVTSHVATLIPAQPLKNDSFYTAKITTGVRDAAGNNLASPLSWFFTTLDLTPPAVVSVAPQNGVSNVAPDVTVKITFSESMDKASVEAPGSIALTGPNGPVDSDVTYDDATRGASLKPKALLDDDSIYFAKVTTDVKDKKGNQLAAQVSWSFITRDTQSPAVAYRFPASGSQNVQVTTAITATFSEPVDPATVNTRTLKLEDTTSQPPVQVPGLVSYSALTQVATFTPYSRLANSTNYTVTVTTDVRDSSGNQLLEAAQWSFTTLEGGDVTAPSVNVAEVFPPVGGANVALSATILAPFSEAMDPGSITVDSFKLFDAEGVEVEGGVSYDANTRAAVFKPKAALASNSFYVAEVGTTAKDAAGNPMLRAFSWGFTTMDVIQPSVLWTVPANGAKEVLDTSPVQAAISEAVDATLLLPGVFTIITDADPTPLLGRIDYDSEKHIVSFVPNPVNGKQLKTDTRYIAKVTVGVKDLAGNPLAEQKTWAFTTKDTIAPTVKAQSPAPSAQGVSSSATVSVTFSEPMDPKSVNEFAFKLLDPVGVAVPGAISYDPIYNRATLVPLSSLGKGGSYTATLSSELQDEAGNPLGIPQWWTFTVAGSADTTPPTVVEPASPAAGSERISITTSVSASFNEPIDPNSINSATFYMVDRDGDRVGGSVTYDQGTKKATFKPAALLDDATFYTVRLTTGVTDLAGNHLAQTYVWSFTTVDMTPPAVLSLTPANGQTNVSTKAGIVAIFSEPMDATTVTAAGVFKVTGPGGAAAGQVTYDNSANGAVFTPLALAPLAPNTVYFATIAASAKDMSGNAMPSQVTWSFSTEDTVAPVVALRAPSPGARNVPVGTSVMASFSEPVDPLTVSGFTFYLDNTSGETPVRVPGAVSFDPHSLIAIFSPGVALEPSTRYTATVAGSVRDLAGNAIGPDSTWVFDTMAASDAVAPAVFSVAPKDGDADVLLTSGVSATFTEAIDPSTIAVDTFTLADSLGNPVPSVRTYDATTMTATLQPLMPLASNTYYVAVVTTGVADLAGNPLTQKSWVFTTVDLTAPSVVSLSPANGSTQVAVGAGVTATFSEPMNEASVEAAGSFTLTDSAGAPVPGSVTYDPATASATFRPAAPLAANTHYLARITTAVADATGNPLGAQKTWGFTTVDLLVPAVVARSPGSAASEVPLNATVAVAFSERMDPETVNEFTFTLVDAGNVAVPGAITYDEVGQRALFTPLMSLQKGTAYTVALTTGVQDEAGNRLAQVESWSFTTTGIADNTPPSVASTVPDNGAVSVALTSHITVTFNEAIDPATINSTTFLVTDRELNPVAGAITYDPATRTARMIPASFLTDATFYIVSITTGVTDLAGNPLAKGHRWGFTTSDMTPPSVVAVDPADGANNAAATVVTAIFSEPMDAASVEAAGVFTLVGPAGEVLCATVYDVTSRKATCTPAAPLADNSLYYASVSQEAADLAGNALVNREIWSFTTRDTVLPQVIDHVPASNALNVAVNGNVRLTFSEAMDPATLNALTVRLERTGGPNPVAVAGSISYDGASRLVTFAPSLPLESGTGYEVSVTADVRDLAGNRMGNPASWTFTTSAAPDAQGPVVDLVTPADGQAGLLPTTTVTARFSEPVETATLTTDSVKLLDPVGDAVPGNLTYNPLTAVVTFLPSAPLTIGARYVAVVTTGVTDKAGNALTDQKSWSFTIQAAPDLTPPSVEAVSPVNGATQVPLAAEISATFSEAMDEASVEASFTLADSAGIPVAGVAAYDPATGAVTFTHGPLAADTYYIARITMAATDAAGNPLTAQKTWAFTTVDQTVPAIVARVPAAGAAGVSTATLVEIMFSEPLDASSVNLSTVTLSAGAQQVAGTVSYSASMRVATFTPAAALQGNTVYTVALTGGVRDVAGNSVGAIAPWTFTTATGPDTVAPSVTGVTPADLAVGIATTSGFTATFSEAIDAATLTADSVKLLDAQGAKVAGNVTYNPGTLTATFLPASAFANSTRYVAVVTTGVKDRAGNALADQKSWSFTTAAPADATAPTVTGRTPASAAVGVALDTSVTVDFSEPVDPATITGESVKLLDPSGAKVAGVVGYDSANNRAILQPAAPLSANSYYVAVVSTSVKDLAGNALAVQESWGFKTLDLTAPVVIAVTPVNRTKDVHPASDVAATFSEDMDATTVNGATFTLTDSTGANVAGVVTYDAVTKTANFNPNGDLNPSTEYLAKLSMGIKDASGNTLGAQLIWRFTTVDNVAPTVAATNPAANATYVDTAIKIQVVFSEAMDSTTITVENFLLSTLAGDRVPGTISYDPETHVASFTPSDALAGETGHRVTVATLVRDLSGNQLAVPFTWDFITASRGQGDSIIPAVLSSVPAKGAIEVPVDSSIRVTFSEAIDPATLMTKDESGEFALKLLNSLGVAVSGAISYDENTLTATFKPVSSLAYGAHYVIVVTTAVKDLAGNPLDVEVRWTFRTTTIADGLSPSIVLMSPVDGATQVALSNVVTARFSEAMDAETITSSSFTLVDGTGNPVAGQVSYDALALTATFDPDAPLAANAYYMARMTSAITDSTGVPLASDKTWGFSTLDTIQPTVIEKSPPAGANGVPVSAFLDVLFSEAMDGTTINRFTFTLTDTFTGVEVPGSVTYDATNRTGMLVSFLYLDPSTTYKARLSGAITDVNGNPLTSVEWTFTTDTAANTNPPTVTGTTPGDGENNVALNSTVTATFSKSMDATTMTTANFLLTDGVGVPVAGRVTFDATTKTLNFVPDAPLAGDSFYVAQVLAAVKDTEGAGMVSGKVWSFRTASSAVVVPTVTLESPVNGDLNVAEGATVTVGFNKHMDPATVNASTFLLSGPYGPAEGAITYDAVTDKAVFKPKAVLLSNAYYTVRITTGVRDLSGLTINGDAVWAFTTANTLPTVTGVSPLDKSTGVQVTGTIYVDFSKDMDPLTVNTNNFLLTGPSGPVSGKVSYTYVVGLGVYRATFTPTYALATDSYYVVQVLTGVKDLSGNTLEAPKVWSFTTNTLSDTTPPIVISKTPWDGASSMSVVTKVSATFSETMDSTSLGAAFTLYNVDDSVAVSGRVTYDDTTHVATFLPDAQLANNKKYRATVSAQAKDEAGNEMTDKVEWTFSTIGAEIADIDFSGYYEGKYISSSTKTEGVKLILLQPAMSAGATFTGNFSTDSNIFGTISGKVSGKAASVTVTVSTADCTGTFWGSAVGAKVEGVISITINYLGQACSGPEFASISVSTKTP